MALTPGTKLGPYEIQSPLGAGGMGEVYRARDTRLERTVAIKVLPANLSSDQDLRQRLEREAKAVSKLSHPRICTLHDIGHQDGIDFLVMELLEGETLEQRLMKGPLPLEPTARYGAQIADALAQAHKLGITHRDLKPANIKLTKAAAKLMDLGLAKQSDVVQIADALTQLTVEQSKLTREGTILGTFQYMAPEQLEGKEADPRTDIFALGEVIYEMATGKPAFASKSRASLIAAILTSEPRPMAVLQPMTPPALERVVKKCLAKDPDERWQSAADLASELRWIAEGGGHAPGATPSTASGRTRERLAWLIVSAVSLTLIVGLIWWRNSKLPEQSMQFYAPLPFPARAIAIAPNGHTVAVVGYLESARKNMLWIYELGSSGATALANTGGASYPFWSPDGRSLAFFADGKLRKLELSSGQVQTICDAPSGRGGAWNKDGVIVFKPVASVGGTLYRVSASGGTPTALGTPDQNPGEINYRWPMFLPDGKHYLYMSGNFAGQKSADAIFVGSLDSDERRFVVEADANPNYVAPGYLLFHRDKTLFAQRFDLQSFALTGEPITLLTDIHYEPQIKWAVFAVSDRGLLIAQTGSGESLSQPIWFDRKGNKVGSVGKPDVWGDVAIAPNGKSIAASVTDTAIPNSDIWIYELQRESARRLTFDPAYEAAPLWGPDSSRLVFYSNRERSTLYIKDADGAQPETRFQDGNFDNVPNDWSRDGKYILYTRGEDLWFVTVQDLKSSLFLKAASVLTNGQFSPDGKWVAYASNETGQWEIYVTSFPEPRGKWQISTGGGEQPRWRGDGRELYYLSADAKVMAAPVTTGASFNFANPVALFQASPRQPVSARDLFAYDVSRDGQRFLIITQIKQTETAPMSVILDWPAKPNK